MTAQTQKMPSNPSYDTWEVAKYVQCTTVLKCHKHDVKLSFVYRDFSGVFLSLKKSREPDQKISELKMTVYKFSKMSPPCFFVISLNFP